VVVVVVKHQLVLHREEQEVREIMEDKVVITHLAHIEAVVVEVVLVQ
jgi:3-methyladenine DNA glycosylase Tag